MKRASIVLSVFTITLCAVGSLSLAQSQVKDAKTALNMLSGTWIVDSASIADKKLPADMAPPMLSFQGNTMKGFGPEMVVVPDPTKKPAAIDLIFQKKDEKFAVRAIYELKGDKLKLCIPMAQPGIPFKNIRPRDFNSKDEVAITLEATRAKKD